MKRNRFKKFVDFWLAKTDFWLEKGWGGSIDHVSLGDNRIVLRETRRMDDEHGAFWVGSYTHHYVMEVEKNLTIYFVFGETAADSLKFKAADWKEVIGLYRRFLAHDHDGLHEEFEARQQQH